MIACTLPIGRWIVLASCVGVATAASSLAAAEAGLERWAIIASPAATERGLSDLLAVELTKLEGIELVEREDLDRIANELGVARLSAAEGSPQRLKVGQLLQADALIVLAPPQVVICECRQGARLAEFEFAEDEGSPELTARNIAAEIQRIRKHFAGGIRLIVGVSPFLSQNLEHRYDHLQSRYGDLLARSLALHSGVAVIEVEEARAIREERSLGASGAIRHNTPFLVSGRFRMVPVEGHDEPNVKLTIELSAAYETRELPAPVLPLSKVPAWIVSELATQVLAAAGDEVSPLTGKQQREALSRRADAFSRLGDWPRSVGLREASLVLKPDDAEQRARLVDEYQQRFVRDFDRLWRSRKVPEPERLPLFERTADRYITALDHIEYLIRNRRVSHGEALALFGRQKWEGPGAYFLVTPKHPDAEKPILQRVLDAERRFVIDVFPAMPRLPKESALPGVIVPVRFPQPWHEVLILRVVNHVNYRQRDRHSLEFMHHVLTRILPPEVPTSLTLRFFLCSNLPRPDDLWSRDWHSFLKTLAESEHEATHWYGRAALSHQAVLQLGSLYQADKAAIRSVLTKTEALFKELASHRPANDDLVHFLTEQKRQLLWHIDPAKVPDSPPSKAATETFGRLRFQPVDLRAAQGGGPLEVAPGLLVERMLQCGQVDAFWTKEAFYLMERPGTLRRLPLAGHPEWSKYEAFSHVMWDGEMIWLVVAGRGIYVLDADGTHVATFDISTPLPGIERGLQMLPLAPRRMLAVGSFGEHARAWCGILEIDADGKPAVNVFYEARRVPDGRPAAEANADPETAFQPTWIHRFHGRDGRTVALVGRGVRTEALAIDCETLDMSLVTYRTRGYGANEALFSHNGHLIQVTGSAVYRFPPHDGSERMVQGNKLFEHKAVYRQLLPYDGWAYVPGFVWRRIHPETLQVECLLPARAVLPRPYRCMRFGVSAHYGLVGFPMFIAPKSGSPVLYKVTIREE